MNTFAVVQIGSKQYQVREKSKIKVEKIEVEKDKSFSSEKVLLLSQDGNLVVGRPYLPDAKIEFKVLEQGKGEKIRIFKMKPKKRYRRTKGHRQLFTELEVVKILRGKETEVEMRPDEKVTDVEMKKKTSVKKTTVKKKISVSPQ